MTKKILHLTYDMRIGGTETVIKNLAEGVDVNKFETEILCIEPTLGPFGVQLKDKGIKISNLHWAGGFDIRLIKKIRHYILVNNVDVLHCHQYTPWVYGTLAAAFTDVKVIFTEHGRFYPDSSSWKRKLINPILLKLTDHVTAISKATKQALIEFEFIPEHLIDVIYNGIEPLVANEQKVSQLRKGLGIPNGAMVVGTVARLDPIKNQTMMVKAFASVLQKLPNIYLMIVGDGEERQKLETLVNELNIRHNVIFTGYVAKPVFHIALMDVFLLSSLSEGTSVTLLEALSLGVPCVVTDAGGNPEVILNENTGVVTENADLHAFIKGILKVASDESLIQKMSISAREDFFKRFNAVVMHEHYVKICYEDLSYSA